MVQSGVMCFSAIRAEKASWAWVCVVDIASSGTGRAAMARNRLRFKIQRAS